jgi:hypothetical protein
MKRLLVFAISSLAGIFWAACTKHVEETGFSTDQQLNRNTLDGAYAKIYGGRRSYVVFRSKTPGTTEQNTFFAEFEWDDGTMIRTQGSFEYGRDNLGDMVTLSRGDTPLDSGSSNEDSPSPATDEAGASTSQGAADSGPPSNNSDAGSPLDPQASIAAFFGTFHHLKTGAHDTILCRDERDRTYQFKKVSSYCGANGDLDCASSVQRNGDCASGWTCSTAHTCSCGGS